MWKLTRESFQLLFAYAIETGLMSEGGSEPILSERGRKIARRILIANAGSDWDFEITEGSFEDPDEIPF